MKTKFDLVNNLKRATLDFVKGINDLEPLDERFTQKLERIWSAHEKVCSALVELDEEVKK